MLSKLEVWPTYLSQQSSLSLFNDFTLLETVLNRFLLIVSRRRDGHQVQCYIVTFMTRPKFTYQGWEEGSLTSLFLLNSSGVVR